MIINNKILQIWANEQASSDPRNPPPIITIFLYFGSYTASSKSRKSSFLLKVIILSLRSSCNDSKTGRFLGDTPTNIF